MAEVGASAARGEAPGQRTLERFSTGASAAPLRPEPFLVQAAMAERAGDLDRAEALLKQARWRDPRSTAARYLLADVALRRNEVVEGLTEMAAVSRLLAGGATQIVPALSQYAHAPGAREQLAAVLKSNPRLKQPLLETLAADPANADLILALAGPDAPSVRPEAQAWKSRLHGGFVERGQYKRAYGLWRSFAGLPSQSAPLLFNGDFADMAAPPPFNWTFASTSAGLAEPSGGRLRVLYYGRENATLASQLLLLPPGTYRLQAPVTGTAAAGALTWTLTCAAGGKQLMQFDLAHGGAAQFSVPPGCEAQTLSLVGHMQDMPQASDIQLGPVTLQKRSA
jgi:hypothetical protein